MYVHVGDDEAVSTREKDFIGSGSNRPIGCFGDDLQTTRYSFHSINTIQHKRESYLSLDTGCISLVDRLLTSCGNENVALLEHELGEILEVLGSRESLNY